MKLTELQERWLQELEQHPERQIGGRLGYIDEEGNIHACCLGQALLCMRPEKLIAGYEIEDNAHGNYLSRRSYAAMGLRSRSGGTASAATAKGQVFNSLSSMNDDGITWPEIAAYIRANPENVFVNTEQATL